MSDSLIYEDKISHSFCDKVIDFYNTNLDRSQKLVERGKKSNQIFITKEDKIYNEYTSLLKDIVKKYLQKYIWANNTNYFSVSKNIKIQYYKPSEGYHGWHFENDGRYPDIKRHLVFMTYLNNVKDGGTQFLYQNYTTEAVKGKTVIWPTAWTHTHKGKISTTKEKYIITGWFDFHE